MFAYVWRLFHQFGDCFTNELKKSKRGWVDIRVGDFKPSRLNDRLDLKVIGAP